MKYRKIWIIQILISWFYGIVFLTFLQISFDFPDCQSCKVQQYSSVIELRKRGNAGGLLGIKKEKGCEI